MRAKLFIPILALAGIVTFGAASSASAAVSVSQAATSANWSGYVASGKQFSAVSGSWVQPTANCSTGQGNSAFWVGLGGSRDQQSQALEQVGTEADCGGGSSADNFAWYVADERSGRVERRMDRRSTVLVRWIWRLPASSAHRLRHSSLHQLLGDR
jgi:hypothetical protein